METEKRTYKILYDEAYSVEVEATTAEEARDMFYRGEYSGSPQYIEISGVDVVAE